MWDSLRGTDWAEGRERALHLVQSPLEEFPGPGEGTKAKRTLTITKKKKQEGVPDK